MATVATSGDYDDLTNKPTIPDAQVQSDWSQSDNTQVDYIKNKPTIPTNTSDLNNDSWFVGLWNSCGDFTLTNGQTGNLTLSADVSDCTELLICYYLNVGGIGKKPRATFVWTRFDYYYTGCFFDKMVTASDRIYFQLDRVDGTHLSISSCNVPTGLNGSGIKIYYR